MTSLSTVASEHHIEQKSPIHPHSATTPTATPLTIDHSDELPGQIVYKKVHVPLSYPPPPGALKLQSDVITVFPPPKPADMQSSPTTGSPPTTPSTPSSGTARRSFEALEQQHHLGGAVPSIQRNNTMASRTTYEVIHENGAAAVTTAIPIRRRSSGRAGYPPGRMASMPNLSSATQGPLSSSMPNLSTLPTPMEEEQQGEEGAQYIMQRDDHAAGNVSALLFASGSPARPSALTIQDRRASVSSVNTLHQHPHDTLNSGHPPTTAQNPLPSPPDSPWIKTRRPSVNSKLNRAATMFVAATSAAAGSQHGLLEGDIPYPDLPTNVRTWTSSHVATYLCFILRFYPRAITEDLARYVRQTACLNGEEFLDIQDDDLARMGINQKWRQLIMEGVRALRRETLRMTRSLDGMRWEDGFDPAKDTVPPPPPPLSPPSTGADEQSLGGDGNPSEQVETMASNVLRYSYHDPADDAAEKLAHSRVASFHVHADQNQEGTTGTDKDNDDHYCDDSDADACSDDADEIDLDQFQKELVYQQHHDYHDHDHDHRDPQHDPYHPYHDTEADLGFGHRLQGLKKSFMSSVTSLTNMFPEQPSQNASATTVLDGDETTLLERMGFVEGVVVGGIAVACLMRLVR
ncbi:hypothetical protein BGZ73_005453 [Actinomortierella ambigua]|nr:hypothetical protein BGZ73_005453 [Actinomortierella ambigua]